MTLEISNVVVNCADPHHLAEFWTRALGMSVEPRVGRNRVHIDLHGESRDAAVARLVELGATELGEERPPGLDLVWTVLTDPEGNEFCIGGHAE